MGRRPCRAPEWGWGPRAPLSSVSGRPGRRLLTAGPSCSPRPRGRGPQPRRRAQACPAGGTTCRAGKRRRRHRSHLCVTRTGREARDAAQRHWARTRQTRPGVRSSALIIRVEADDGPLPRLPRGPRRWRVWTGTGLPPGGPVPPRQDRAPWRPRRGGGRKRPSRGHGCADAQRARSQTNAADAAENHGLLPFTNTDSKVLTRYSRSRQSHRGRPACHGRGGLSQAPHRCDS